MSFFSCTPGSLLKECRSGDGSLGPLDKLLNGPAHPTHIRGPTPPSSRLSPTYNLPTSTYNYMNNKKSPVLEMYKSVFNNLREKRYGGNRTPNPYAQDSSKTPGWGRTPNPYVQQGQQSGSKTPAWGASSSPPWDLRTPNPYTKDAPPVDPKNDVWDPPDHPRFREGAYSPKYIPGVSSWDMPDKWGDPAPNAVRKFHFGQNAPVVVDGGFFFWSAYSFHGTHAADAIYGTNAVHGSDTGC